MSRVGQHQAFLRTGHSDEERTAFISLFSPKRLLFDAENYDGMKFQAFAFVNGQNTNSKPNGK